jgi:hypothetical protein
LGNPNTSAWAESMTLLQLRISLILHEGTNWESLRSFILSIVNKNEAIKPTIAPIVAIRPEKNRVSNLIAEL